MPAKPVDLDDVFAYETPKVVLIRDRYVDCARTVVRIQPLLVHLDLRVPRGTMIALFTRISLTHSVPAPASSDLASHYSSRRVGMVHRGIQAVITLFVVGVVRLMRVLASAHAAPLAAFLTLSGIDVRLRPLAIPATNLHGGLYGARAEHRFY